MNELKTSRAIDVDIAVPVLKSPPTSAGLAGMLRSQLESMGLPRIRRNDRSMAIRKLEAYLSTLPAGPVGLDEALLNSFEDWLVNGDEARRIYHRKMTSHVRSIVNAFPDGTRNRPLLTNTEVNRLDRFGEFSQDTRELLVRFLADGRRVKRTQSGLAPSSVLLSPSTRDRAVSAITMILRLLGVEDMRRFNVGHVERYLAHCGEDGRDSAVHTLWNMRCLFRWLVAMGTIKEDPLAGIGRHRTHADKDYVPAAQITKLTDLAILDLGDFRAVRDRLIAFALCYDCALRIGEAARLRLDDIRVGDFVEVGVRSEIQKGSGKPSITFRNLFPESKVLFEAYLQLRRSMNMGTGSLLVSEKGRPLLVSGCRNAVKRVGAELGIVTDGGKVPAPHRYRHSLGTLNIGEIGMKLTPYYLMRRYRHNDIRTTIQVYVTNNPLLDEAQHIAIVNAANGNGQTASPDPQPQSVAPDINVPEMDAMARVRSLGVNWVSLRKHAKAQGAAVERQGKTFYSASFIDRLCSEWMTREEAIRLMGITSETAFRNRARNHGIGILVIGKASLAKSADVIRSLRR